MSHKKIEKCAYDEHENEYPSVICLTLCLSSFLISGFTPAAQNTRLGTFVRNVNNSRVSSASSQPASSRSALSAWLRTGLIVKLSLVNFKRSSDDYSNPSCADLLGLNKATKCQTEELTEDRAIEYFNFGRGTEYWKCEHMAIQFEDLNNILDALPSFSFIRHIFYLTGRQDMQKHWMMG